MLASGSPRRTRILDNLGVPHRVSVSEVAEDLRPGEAPEAAAERLARAKAEAVASRETLPVLGADTIVVCDGAILGKPGSDAAASEMLRRLSGRTHAVVSAVSLVSPSREAQVVATSQVTFDPLDDAQIDAYLATGEHRGKAGAYAIQGAAEAFVARLDGSFSGVMGLPLRETSRLLREFGLLPAAAAQAR